MVQILDKFYQKLFSRGSSGLIKDLKSRFPGGGTGPRHVFTTWQPDSCSYSLLVTDL